jgi:hypothetical protein
MLLVLVAGIWMGRQVNKAREQREAVEAVKAYGGWVHYDWEFVNGKLSKGTTPWAPAWLRRTIGDDFFQDVAHVSLVYDDSTGKRYDNLNTRPCDDLLALLEPLGGIKQLLLQGTQVTDEGMRHISGMSGLDELYIWDATEVSDAGVAHLKDLGRLRKIHISRSKIGDASLGTLGGLPRLEDMALQGNHFTDAGLALLKRSTNLKRLWIGLGETKITDAGMAHLSGLTNLELLDLQGTEVTERGLDHLKTLKKLTVLWFGERRITKEAMPNLKSMQ